MSRDQIGHARILSSGLMFVCALAAFIYALASPRSAEASVQQFVIGSPVWNPGNVNESGWHFAEGGNWAAKDFPPQLCGYQCWEDGQAILWADMSLTSGYYWRYDLYEPYSGSCRAYATGQWSTDNLSWNNATGLSLRYIHLSSVATDETASMKSSSSGIWHWVGTIATGSPCVDGTTGEPNVHLSADAAELSATYSYRVNLDNETCWASSDGYCHPSGYNFTYTRKNQSPSDCVAVTSGGPFYRSGTIDRYDNCYWMEKSHTYADHVFEMWF